MGIRSRTDRGKKGVWLCLGLLGLALAILLACEAKDEGGPTGPGTLPTDDPVVGRGAGVLLADGSDSLMVHAFVFSEWGAPLQGIAVRFTTSVGTITPAAVTDADGLASAVLRSRYSASDLTAQVCATIPERADSSALPSGKTAPTLAPPALQEGARIVRLASAEEGAGSLEKAAVTEAALMTASRSACMSQTMLGVTVRVSASETRIPADGVSRTTIRALFTETEGDVPIVGSTLRFASSAGAIGAEAQTDEEGVASVHLTSSTSPGACDIDVYVGSSLAGETGVQFAPIRMTLAADPASVNADGASVAEIAATLLTEESTPLGGLRVVFETDAGVVSSPETTGTDGRAVATLRSPEEAGTARIVARFGDVLAESVEVSFVKSFLPAEIVLSADPAEITADGLSGSLLRAVVHDSNGVSVPDGTPIRFALLSGGGTIGGLAGTLGGAATMTLTSATEAALATVRAYSGGVADTVSVRYVPGPAARIALSADPGSLLANGVDDSRITAIVTDFYGNTLEAGVAVEFEAALGTIEESAITNGSGVATVTYTSAFGVGEDKITARVGSAVGQLIFPLYSGAPTAILLDSLDYDAIRIQGTGHPEAATMVFRLHDKNGVPIGADRPTAVSFHLIATSPQGGEHLSSSVDTTDEWGRVRATLISGTAPGVTQTVARIVGSSPLVESQVIPIAIHGTLPHADHLDIDADTLNIPGLKYSDWEDPMTALVYDQFSNPAPQGTAVYFSTNYGGITGSDTTDSQGRAHATFISMNPYPPDGLVTITAQTADSLGNRITNSTVIRLSGPTAPLVVSPATFTIPNAGYQTFTYELKDVYGNPLTHHTRVEVTTTGGSLGGAVDFEMPDVISGHTSYTFFLGDNDTSDNDPPMAVFVTIEVTSLNDNETITISGTID